jgi:hypothetical protein
MSPMVTARNERFNLTPSPEWWKTATIWNAAG